MGQVVVGTVRRAHGMKGQLLVHPETDDPEGVYQVGNAFTVPDAPKGRVSQLTLASAGWSAKGWRLGFAEISDREAAESFAGCTLEVAEEELAALAENEFFLHDLIGLDVQDAQGASTSKPGSFGSIRRRVCSTYRDCRAPGSRASAERSIGRCGSTSGRYFRSSSSTRSRRAY
ncbi:MAG: ribosome maturation factor RimM [Gemmatimonadales bacterium]